MSFSQNKDSYIMTYKTPGKMPPIMGNIEFIKKIVLLAKAEHGADFEKTPKVLYDCLSDDAKDVVREITKSIEKNPASVDGATTEVFKDVKLQTHQSNVEVIRHIF